jgi:hypothetical protein
MLCVAEINRKGKVLDRQSLVGDAALRHSAHLEGCAEELKVADVADHELDVLAGDFTPSARGKGGVLMLRDSSIMITWSTT